MKRFSRFLLAFFVTCTLAGLAAWFTLLTTICHNPRAPVQETQHIFAYSCHGMTVYISPLENWMLYSSTPIEMLFIFLSLVSAVMVALTSVKIKIEVKANITDTSDKNTQDDEDYEKR